MSLLFLALMQVTANPRGPEQASPPPPQIRPQERIENRPRVRPVGNGAIIRTIDFRGVAAPAPVAKAAEGFLGKPATQEVLTALAAALSAAYEKTDIALYTVQIPDQDVAGGKLVVDLIEGSIDTVNVAPQGGRGFPLLQRRANALAGEKPLRRSHLERQLALIQGIPGLTLDAGLDNPEGDDTVALNLIARQKKVSAAFGINNRGPHLLGSTVLQAGVDFYRMITDGDRLSFSGYATPDLRHYRAIDGSYLVPLTADGLTLTATAAAIGTRARSVDIAGSAQLAGLTLAYPLVRRARLALDVTLGVDGANSRNALFGNIFATERSRAVRLGTSLTAIPGNTTIQFTGALSHGLDILGADAGASGAQIAFTKVSGEAAIEQSLGPRIVGRLHGLGQYSDSPLPAVELIGAGGGVIGRAFDTGLLTGDSGIGGFFELAYRPVPSGDFAPSEAYLFGDAGRIHANPRLGFPGQSFSLASAGAGLRAKYKDRIQLGVEAAAVLQKPYPAYDEDYRVNVYYSVTF